MYQLKVKNPAGGTVADFSAFVMVPSKAVREGVLNAYQIGFYPDTPLKGNPIYVPPKGFIEVTKDNEDTKVSPNFRIKEFLTKQKSGYPKYLVLDERLVFLLEAIGAHLEPLGWDAGDIFVMSGYRTPYYNKQLDDTKYSLHQWGRAADIFLDKDDNGRMDDFNNDKVISREDAVALAGVLEGLAKTAELSSFIGGLGIYGSTSAHGPFVHVDTRPSRARGELFYSSSSLTSSSLTTSSSFRVRSGSTPRSSSSRKRASSSTLNMRPLSRSFSGPLAFPS